MKTKGKGEDEKRGKKWRGEMRREEIGRRGDKAEGRIDGVAKRKKAREMAGNER